MNRPPLRILMLDNEFPPLGGGTGMVNLRLLEEFAKTGEAEVDLVTSSRTRATYEHETMSPGIEIYKVPVNNQDIHHATNRELLTYAARAFFTSRQLIKKRAYDLCFAFSTFPAGVVALWLYWSDRLPYMVSLQGPDVPGFERRYNYLYPFLRPIARLTWRNAAAVTAISEQHKNLALETWPALEPVIIYNGVNLDLFEPRDWAAIDYRSKPIVILCVARLVERKGHRYLVEAASILKRQGLGRFKMVFIGTGDEEPRLRALCGKLGLEDTIEFTGFVSHEQVLQAYGQADIFALPSYNEGMSIALLEALAASLPVIVTDTGGTKELVDGNGVIVPWADSAAIARALADFMQSPDMIGRMGQRSREIAQQFDWSQAAQRHLDLFHRITERRPKGGNA